MQKQRNGSSPFSSARVNNLKTWLQIGLTGGISNNNFFHLIHEVFIWKFNLMLQILLWKGTTTTICIFQDSPKRLFIVIRYLEIKSVFIIHEEPLYKSSNPYNVMSCHYYHHPHYDQVWFSFDLNNPHLIWPYV